MKRLKLNYKVIYIDDSGNTKSVVIQALNRVELLQKVVNEITDMKDNDADNIVKVEVI